ncbi:hypothetical protein FUSO7_13020, partial [Fusobacterium necrophorum BFTR-2]
KEELNRDKIKEFSNIVIIFHLKNSWGILCNTPIELYKKKKILSHELVLSDVIQRMLSNFHAYNCEANPVMLIHNKKLELKKFVKECKNLYSIKKENITLYVYEKREAQKILHALEDIKKIYIADGHHRFYSTSLYTEKREVLSCIYEISELKIEAIPRKITNIKLEDFKKFREKIEKEFILLDSIKKLKKGEVRIFYENEKITFKLKEINGDLFDNNDVYRMNTQLISNIFRIFKEEKILYLSEQKLKEELKNPEKETIYIELSSMKNTEFLEIVDGEKIMPPKSTYFKPKFPSFLVFNYFRK